MYYWLLAFYWQTIEDIYSICELQANTTLRLLQLFSGWLVPLRTSVLWLFAFSALTLLVGWQEGYPACKKQWWGCWCGCLSGAGCRLRVQTCIWPSWCYCHSLSVASVKSRLVLPFWYRLIWVVPEKGPLNGCVCVYSSTENEMLCVVGHLHIFWPEYVPLSVASLPVILYTSLFSSTLFSLLV